MRALKWPDIGATAGPLRALAVTVFAFLVLFMRRPETLTVAEFYADDSHFYQDALARGAGTLTMTYAGYLSIIQRVVALAEVSIPPLWAPVLSNAVSLLIVALVAAFLTSDRISAFLPERRHRFVLAGLFVMLPAVNEMYGTMLDIQWIVAVYVIAMLVATPPTSTRGRMGDAIGLLIGGMTGPTTIMLLPLFALRAYRDKVWRWHLFIVAWTAFLQVVMFSVSFRNPSAPTDWSLFPQVFAFRTFVVPLTGAYGPDFSWPLAIAVMLAVGTAAWQLPRTWVLGALFIGLLFPLAGLRATQAETFHFLFPPAGARYFFLTGVVMVALIVVALSRRHWLALPAAALLCMGIVADARIPPVEPFGWARYADCIGGPVPCSVPVAPTPDWNIHWP